MTSNITSFNYAALREALTNAEVAKTVEMMRDSFASRSKLIMSSAQRNPPAFLVRHQPGRSMSSLMSANSSARQAPGGTKITDAPSLSEAMLNEVHIAFVPGNDFGGCGPNHVRISFACSQ